MGATKITPQLILQAAGQDAEALSALEAAALAICRHHGLPDDWEAIFLSERTKYLEIAAEAVAAWYAELGTEFDAAGDGDEDLPGQERLDFATPSLADELVALLERMPGRGCCTIAQAATWAQVDGAEIIAAVRESDRLEWVGNDDSSCALTLARRRADEIPTQRLAKAGGAS